MNTKIILSIVVLLFCFSCKNKIKEEAKIDTEQEAIIDIAIEIQEDVSQDSLIYFEIPENPSFKDIISNFYKYRDEERLFEGLNVLEVNGYHILAYSDTLVIFNFDKGTVKGVKRSRQQEEREQDFIYYNYIKGFPTDATITGDFNGDGKKDSLMIDNFEQLSPKYDKIDGFSFSFSDKTIPKLEVWGNLCYTIKNEGDLDGDGGDEIGFLYGWGTSACRTYNVFTLKKNKWYKLIEELDLTYDVRATGIVPVEKDPEQDDVILIRTAVDIYCNTASYIVEKSVRVKDLKLKRKR